MMRFPASSKNGSSQVNPNAATPAESTKNKYSTAMKGQLAFISNQ